MTAATFIQHGLPGLIGRQETPFSLLLPIGHLGADAGRDVVGHAPHGILGKSLGWQCHGAVYRVGTSQLPPAVYPVCVGG